MSVGWEVLVLLLTVPVMAEGLLIVALMRHATGDFQVGTPISPGVVPGGPEIGLVVEAAGLDVR